MQLLTRAVRHCLSISVLTAFAFSVFAQSISLPNGKIVARNNFHLFICIGNSAMSGRDTIPDLVADDHVWKFRVVPANHDWKPGVEPACQDAYNTEASPNGGPTIPLVKELELIKGLYFLGTNDYIGIMQLSASGWAMAPNFAYGKTQYNTIMTYAKQLAPNAKIEALVSMFNMVEVQNCANANCIGNYSGDIQAMVASMRNDLKTVDASLANLPYFHAGYPVMAGNGGNGIFDTSTAQAKAMIAEIAKIPGLVNNSWVIPTDSCSICHNCDPKGYWSHYDSYGNKRWGKRAADTIAAHIWIPVAALPAVQHNLNSSHTATTMQKVLFDGSNWTVFDKVGKSFNIYSPNGRAIAGMSAAALRNQKLLPGVYFVRKDVKK
jgi:hypothetical protein